MLPKSPFGCDLKCEEFERHVLDLECAFGSVQTEAERLAG